MEATSTFHIQPATAKAVKANDRHNQHSDDTEHSNTQLVRADRELNHHTIFHEEDEVLEVQYGDYLRERNAKLDEQFLKNTISSEQRNERQQTINEYLNGANGSRAKKAYTEGVMTVGSLEIQEDLLKQLGFDYRMITVGSKEKGTQHEKPQLTDPAQRRKWSELFHQTYLKTAEQIDQLEGFSVLSVDTHMDEGGEPQAHIKMLNMGQTKSGKPSASTNSAVKDCLGDLAVKDTRKNLKTFRKHVDSATINNFNETAHDMGFSNVNLELVRTGAKGGKDMDDYQQYKQQKDRLEELREQNKASESKLTQREQYLQQREDSYQQRLIRLRKRESEIADREKQVSNRLDTVSTQKKFMDKFVCGVADKLNVGTKEVIQGLTTQRLKFAVPQIKTGKWSKGKYTGGEWALKAIEFNSDQFTKNDVRSFAKSAQKQQEDDGLDF